MSGYWLLREEDPHLKDNDVSPEVSAEFYKRVNKVLVAAQIEYNRHEKYTDLEYFSSQLLSEDNIDDDNINGAGCWSSNFYDAIETIARIKYTYKDHIE